MKKFKGTILSTVYTDVTVNAETEDEARDLLWKMIYENKISIDPLSELQEQELTDVEEIVLPKDPNEEYFQFLERLRKSGVTNMFGASPYLAKAYGLSQKEASKILGEWMSRYDELNKKYGWQ